MYLKLGNTYLNYKNESSKFNIISEVVDSSISYENPVLVKNINELDIWFGRDFTNRDYFVELITSGVVLYLYRPISNLNNDSNYIDYSNFIEIDNIFISISDLPELGEKDTIYKVSNTEGYYIENGSRYNKYIWYDDDYVDVQLLPQNLGYNNSISLLNRDTLKLNYNKFNGPSYTYPKFNGIELIEDYPEIENSTDEEKYMLLNNFPELDKINLGYSTLSFDISFNSIEDLYSNGEVKYIILTSIPYKDKEKENILIWFKDSDKLPKIDSKYYNRDIYIDILNKNLEDIVQEFKDILKDLGYKIINESELSFSIYSFYKLDCSYFYNIPNFYMKDNFDITQNLLSGLTKNDTRIEFISKLIGKDNTEDIKIKIEQLSTKKDYKITISKYDYYEIFEGNLTDNRIDNLINNSSNLVKCNIIQTFLNEEGKEISYLSNSERDCTLPTGEWNLRRGKKEMYDINMYWKSLNIIFNSSEEYPFDYFLIPNIHKYVSKLDDNFDYYKEYLDLLNYAKSINCQILIQNSDTIWEFEYVDSIPNNPKENIVYVIKTEDGEIYMAIIDGIFQETTDREIVNFYKNDFVFNYTKDIDNRLIYFYRPIIVYGNERPGYYLFLKFLLSDIYVASESNIIYNSPVNNPYDEEQIEITLEKYKSNYLVNNNQFYYYKKYLNGEDYYTSIWMRFCLGKVYRELVKNKWVFLSYRTANDIQSSIKNVLENISYNYSIIRRINITNFNINFQKQLITLTINTYISDLIDNNISIDIILNYNE